MLGKLFNLGAGAGTPPLAQPPSQKTFPLESVQEDIHTRHLLFPDPQDLFEHRPNQLYPLSSISSASTHTTSNAFDYNADIELDIPDVRIIIMQDALSSVAASLLYDSQPPPPVPPTSLDRPSATAGSYVVQEPRKGPLSPRKPSISLPQRPMVIQSGSPRNRQGAFDRRPSVHSRNQGCIESESQRAWREYREELATFSSCIFGNSELMAYKGTSTKVHVVPSDVRQLDGGFGDGRNSIGRSTMRTSRLSQSFTSENQHMFTSPTSNMSLRSVDRKKVLITRLFPVNLPLDEDISPFSDDNIPDHSKAAEHINPKRFQPRQKRTPMYAVALIISLPPSNIHATPAANALRYGFKSSSSYAEQDSFPSSFSSTRRSGWTFVGQGGGGGQDLFDTSFGSETDDQIDAITQHWDIIMRTLSHLQTVVASTLFTMLRQADRAFPDPVSPLSTRVTRGSAGSSRRGDDGAAIKTTKTNAKHITLLPNCLLDNKQISAEVDAARTRVVAGIRASRVTTGQNRWPIWREEARWVARWAAGKEQGFFFFNLLTAFLATHTDWMQALCPPSYRRRHYLHQRTRAEEDASVPARTIIVSDNKIAARRLIFLLSAFLPASQLLPGPRAHRPSTPASLSALSQSPPSFVVPILKEESLRRKINRRTGSRMPSHSRNLSVQSHAARAGGSIPLPLAHLSMEGRHERRASDAASIRTTQLPIRGTDPRKTGAATTTTITPETSIPHFSGIYRADIFSQGRPGSSNSVAADDLKRLTRDESPGSQSSAGGERWSKSRWSTVISGIWKKESTAKPTAGQPGSSSASVNRRESVAAVSSKPAQATQVPGPPAAGQPGNANTFGTQPVSPKNSITPSAGHSSETHPPAEAPCLAPNPQRIPDPSSAFESPVKTSINLDDGVIDVDVPLPDFITSFESAVSSPSSSGYLSASGFGTGLDAFEQSCRFSADGDAPINVAGWLQHYHPDFILQAVPAQHGLIDHIKASMQAEPTPQLPPGTPTAEDGTTETWVDVASAIVADATTFTITRIRYRRLIRLGFGIDRQYQSSWSSPTRQGDIQLKDEFIEEPLVTFDETLIEAVEKVIATGYPGFGSSTTDLLVTETAMPTPTNSKLSSATSSRSNSKRRDDRAFSGMDNTASSTAGAETCPPSQTQSRSPLHTTGLAPPPSIVQEIPRSQCKTVLLSALEDIIHEVIAEREHRQEEEEVTRTLTGEQLGHGKDIEQGQQGNEGLGRERGRLMGGGVGGDKEREKAKERESPLREAVRAWIESVDITGE
mgnify:CR=1 FL=1